MEVTQEILGYLIWVLCPVLILLILVQGGAGDLSSTFGGGGQLDSTLGVGASRKMGKLTGWLSVAFLVIVLFMAIPPGGAYPTSPGTDGDASAATVGDPDADPVQPPLEPAEIETAVERVTTDDAAPVDLEAAAAEAAADDVGATEAEKQDAGLEIEVDQPAAEE